MFLVNRALPNGCGVVMGGGSALDFPDLETLRLTKERSQQLDIDAHKRAGFIDLQSHLPTIVSLSKARDEQKGGYLSTKNWSIGNSTHFVGLCGEMTVSLVTGLPIDEKLRVNGDPGYDFIWNGVTYDVKTATFWSSPDMKEFIDAKKWADMYILVALKYNRYARIVGWATQQQLLAAKHRNYNRGERLSITEDELMQLGQTGVPKELPTL